MSSGVTLIGTILTSNEDSGLKRKDGMEWSRDAPAQEKCVEEDTTNNQPEITSDVHVETIQPFQKIISPESDSGLKEKNGMELSRDAPAQERYGEEDTTITQLDITSDAHVVTTRQPFKKIISSESDSTILKNTNKQTNRRYEVNLFCCFAKAVHSLAKIRTANCPSVSLSFRSSFRILSDISWS